MGYEDNLINNIDRKERRQPPDQRRPVREAHYRAEKLIEADAIDPRDFIDLYGRENVDQDLRRIELLKGRFEEDETKKAAEVLEAIIYEQCELSNWLGNNAETIKTSEFDDIENGVDLVVEFMEQIQTSHLALGVDVTFGTKNIEKKFNKIKAQIQQDQLTTVKYFQSNDFKGSLRNVPRVIIGVELDTVNQLAGLWLQNQKQKLAEHPVRLLFLTQIQKQLEIFLEYAQKNNAQNAIRSYTRALETVRTIRAEQKVGNPSDETADRVHAEISNQLELLSNDS